jgi:hypothetical protein
MTADAAADAAGGTTTNNDMDISVSEDGSEDDSKDKASDDNEGMEDALFCAARDIQNRMSHCVGMAGMEDHHFHEFVGANISIMSMVWDMFTAMVCAPRRATQSICSGCSISSKCTQSRALGVWLLVPPWAQLTQRQ